MTKQIISLGTSANSHTGDPLRTAFSKVNDNFTELYSTLQTADNDLTAISNLAGSRGYLKKISTDVWALDDTTYLSSITSNQVTTALGFTPYSATNPSNYLTGITSSQVTTALGFTPYNSTNPNGYVGNVTASAATFLAAPNATNFAAMYGGGISGTGALVFNTSPTFVTPILGAASATSLAINGGTLSVNASSGISGALWGTNGIGICAPGATYTDTASSSTVSAITAIHALSSPILATSASTTFTTVATLFVGTPQPQPGGTVSITNPYSIYTSGAVFVSGTLAASSNITLNGNSTATTILGTSATTGTTTIGGTSQTGTIGIGPSTASQTIQLGYGATAAAATLTLNIGTGAAVSTGTKTISIGTAGLSGSTTNINIGSAVSGSTTTLTLNGSLATPTAITTAASVGYMGYPQNSTAVSITLALSDTRKHIYVTATGQTVTIPANASVAFPIGTEILIVGAAATSTSIAITTDTMYLAGTGATGTRTLAAYGMARLLKVSSTIWYIRGDGLT